MTKKLLNDQEKQEASEARLLAKKLRDLNIASKYGEEFRDLTPQDIHDIKEIEKLE